MNLNNFEQKIWSQNGEDGITMKLIELLDINEQKFYVEFGVENGNECNTKILRELKWDGLIMDGGYENKNINLQKEFITKENINELFKKYNVPKKINVLSVDIDYNDFYVLKEIIKEYTMDIIICEYNSSHLPTEDCIVIYNPQGKWDGTNYFGVSLLTLTKLLTDYILVCCDNNGVNAFFIHKKFNKNIIGLETDILKLYKPPKYGRNGHPKDYLNRKYISFNESLLY